MQIFEHLADDELLLIYEENRNKRQELLHTCTTYFEEMPGRLLDLDGEMSLIRREFEHRTGVVLQPVM